MRVWTLKKEFLKGISGELVPDMATVTCPDPDNPPGGPAQVVLSAAVTALGFRTKMLDWAELALFDGNIELERFVVTVGSLDDGYLGISADFPFDRLQLEAHHLPSFAIEDVVALPA